MVELEKALTTLREECRTHENCSGCPLVMDIGDTKECYLTQYTPDRYRLKCDDPNRDKVYI